MRESGLQSGGLARQSWNIRATSSRGRGRLRFGLGILTVGPAVTGVWALAAPRSFFDDFPWPGLAWVSEFPRYSEHLVRDVGAFNLAFAVLLLWSAIGLDRTVVRVALVGWIVFAIPHFVFHVLHLDRYDSMQAIGQMTVLGLGVLLPLLLLSINARLDRRSRRL